MKNLNTKLSNERKILEEAEKIIKQANQTNPQKNSSSKNSKKTTSKTSNQIKQQKNHKELKDSTSLKNVKHNNLKKKIIIVIAFIIIFALIILSFIFGFITSKSNKIISGVSINGYRGRIALHEVLEINQEIRDAITNNIRKSELRNLVYNKSDVTSLLKDGLEKVVAGLTSVDEILRVIDVEDDLGDTDENIKNAFIGKNPVEFIDDTNNIETL